MMPNYLMVLAECFPGVEAYTAGDPTVYEELVWVSTPIDKATLDASLCANQNVSYGSVEVQGNLEEGDTLVWDGASWIPRSSVDVSGSVMTREFGYGSSNVKNRWLAFTGNNGFPTNEVPVVIPWKCQLVGMTFSNEDPSADTDVMVYAADVGSSNVDTLRLTWEIRNARVGYKTDLDPVIFNAGDKIGIYLQDRGSDPDYPVVTLELKILDGTTGTSVENFSGNL